MAKRKRTINPMKVKSHWILNTFWFFTFLACTGGMVFLGVEAFTEKAPSIVPPNPNTPSNEIPVDPSLPKLPPDVVTPGMSIISTPAPTNVTPPSLPSTPSNSGKPTETRVLPGNLLPPRE